MTIAPGVLVEHAQWGRGKVVEQSGAYVFVHFPTQAGSEGGPRKKVQAASAHLRVADVQSDPALDLVKIGPAGKKKTGKGTKPAVVPTLHSLDQAVSWFQTNYPRLFDDPKLREQELDYKRAAHALWRQLFGEERGRRLLAEARFDEIGSGLDRVHHETNIPSRFEIMAAHDGYKDGEGAAALLRATLAFLENPGAVTFQAMASAVGSLPAPENGSRVLTWPNATILPFLADPTRFMVVKPQITRKMARRMDFDILYSSEVTWHCYERVLRLSDVLLERSSRWEPRTTSTCNRSCGSRRTSSSCGAGAVKTV
jgi:hypothetical protein